MCDCVSPISRSFPIELLAGRNRRYRNSGTNFGISIFNNRRFVRTENYAVKPFRFPESEDFDFLELKREKEEREEKKNFLLGESDDMAADVEADVEDSRLRSKPGKQIVEKKLVLLGESDDVEADVEDDVEERGLRSRRSRQMMRRSSLLAKQVISVRSAHSIGFVSQLWIDAISWTVVAVEVRPHLLSGEIERLLLEDLYQVGDVVLVRDESVIENELKLNGLDTLVGYNVVTTGRRKIGKIRGFNFDINSGAVESLEMDSMGLSLIPSSLVSTYSMTVEDVVQVAADTVVVDQDAESRLQRLTKGLLDKGNLEARGSWEDAEELTGFGNRSGRSARRRRSRPEDYWDLPVDF